MNVIDHSSGHEKKFAMHAPGQKHAGWLDGMRAAVALRRFCSTAVDYDAKRVIIICGGNVSEE